MHDALGTARVQTDDTGTVVGTADYDVYGNLRASSGTQVTEGWTGETKDTTTGLTYLRARDYEPRTGRFISADTESPNGSLTQGFNPYHYTGNNPTTRTDPTGHNWLFQAIDGIGEIATIMEQLVLLTRDLMRNDQVPPFVKQFIGALLAFAQMIVMALLEMLIFNVIMWVYGASRTMIGSALSLSRLRVFTTQGRHVLQCVKGGFCQNLMKFLARNGDCLIAGLMLAVSYGMTGAPNVNTVIGRGSLAADVGFLAKECVDRTPGGGGGGCSFSGDTRVLMADESTKPIEDVELGDQVLAEDPETGERGNRTVTALWVHEDELVDLRIDGDTVTTTEDHPFWNASDREWQRADQIEPGETVLTSNGEERPVEGMDWSTRTGGIAYNLTVADLHTYFVVVGSDEVLVHNSGGLYDGGPSGCEAWADAFIAMFGGTKYRITPTGGPILGEYANVGFQTWPFHEVVVKDGMVFDEFTPNGMPIADWKALWKHSEYINFGF